VTGVTPEEFEALSAYVPPPAPPGPRSVDPTPVYSEDEVRMAIALARRPRRPRRAGLVSFSTVVELLGFGLLVYAAWLVHPILGYIAAGAALLFVGSRLDDEAASSSFHRITDPITDRWRRRQMRRAARRADQKEA
jgi:hypothetical protein